MRSILPSKGQKNPRLQSGSIKYLLFLFLLIFLPFSPFIYGQQQRSVQTITINVSVQHTATLSWSETQAGVVFHVFRSTTSGSNYSMINLKPVTTNSYVDSTIQSGVTYYYVISAFDPSTLLESRYSNEVTAIVPLP